MLNKENQPAFLEARLVFQRPPRSPEKLPTPALSKQEALEEVDQRLSQKELDQENRAIAEMEEQIKSEIEAARKDPLEFLRKNNSVDKFIGASEAQILAVRSLLKERLVLSNFLLSELKIPLTANELKISSLRVNPPVNNGFCLLDAYILQLRLDHKQKLDEDSLLIDTDLLGLLIADVDAGREMDLEIENEQDTVGKEPVTLSPDEEIELEDEFEMMEEQNRQKVSAWLKEYTILRGEDVAELEGDLQDLEMQGKRLSQKELDQTNRDIAEMEAQTKSEIEAARKDPLEFLRKNNSVDKLIGPSEGQILAVRSLFKERLPVSQLLLSELKMPLTANELKISSSRVNPPLKNGFCLLDAYILQLRLHDKQKLDEDSLIIDTDLLGLLIADVANDREMDLEIENEQDTVGKEPVTLSPDEEIELEDEFEMMEEQDRQKVRAWLKEYTIMRGEDMAKLEMDSAEMEEEERK